MTVIHNIGVVLLVIWALGTNYRISRLEDRINELEEGE